MSLTGSVARRWWLFVLAVAAATACDDGAAASSSAQPFGVRLSAVPIQQHRAAEGVVATLLRTVQGMAENTAAQQATLAVARACGRYVVLDGVDGRRVRAVAVELQHAGARVAVQPRPGEATSDVHMISIRPGKGADVRRGLEELLGSGPIDPRIPEEVVKIVESGASPQVILENVGAERRAEVEAAVASLREYIEFVEGR